MKWQSHPVSRVAAGNIRAAAAAAGITLVSQGAATASGSPSWRQSPGTAHLLVAWVGSNGSGSTFTGACGTAGWQLAASGGVAFGWASVWYKANSSGGDPAPVFTDSAGTVLYSQLAEYDAVLTASPVDNSGGAASSASANGAGFRITLSSPDSNTGDLAVACGFWNGANSGGAVSAVFTDSAGSAIAQNMSQVASGGIYFAPLWGVTTETGSIADVVNMNLNVYCGGGGAMVTFKAANPAAVPLSITAQTLPADINGFPYPKKALVAAGGIPPYTWSVASGSVPSGVSLGISNGILSGTCSAAGTFNFTAQVVSGSAASATRPFSVTVNAAPAGTTLYSTSVSQTHVGSTGVGTDMNTAGNNQNASPGFPGNTGFNDSLSQNDQGIFAFGGSQTIGGYDLGHFYATVNATSAGGGAVQTGPASYANMASYGTALGNGTNPTPFSAFTTLTSTYSVIDPDTGTFEAAWDIWTGYMGAGAGAVTSVAAGSNAGSITTIASWSSPSPGVLDVASTTSFPASGSLQVQASGGTWAVVSYTGVTATSFTGCTYVRSLGTAAGTVATGGSVAQRGQRDIMIWMDISPDRGAGGALLHTPNLTFGSYTYDLYYYPYPYPNGPAEGAELMFMLQGAGGSGTFGRVQSGTVDILSPLQWLGSNLGFNLGEQNGAAPYFTLSFFGWEVCLTDGAEDFICLDHYYSWT